MQREHSLKKKLSAFIILIAMLMACQTVTPLPAVTTARDAEFTLAPDQTAMIDGTSLTIRLIGVGGDQRCPSEIECAISGPVSISLSVQTGSGDPTSIDLQTFTDNNGRAPDIQFEGINDRATHEGYLIRVLGVLPYPVKPASPIKSSEYRVTLIVTTDSK